MYEAPLLRGTGLPSRYMVVWLRGPAQSYSRNRQARARTSLRRRLLVVQPRGVPEKRGTDSPVKFAAIYVQSLEAECIVLTVRTLAKLFFLVGAMTRAIQLPTPTSMRPTRKSGVHGSRTPPRIVLARNFGNMVVIS
jgi:hypothetical protein